MEFRRAPREVQDLPALRELFVEPPTLREELRAWLAAIAGHWRTVLLSMAATVALMTAFIWITPPLYLAKAELLIDPRQKQILTAEITPTGLGSSALGADTLLLESQVQVIKSQSVMRRIVQEEGLESDPEFVGSSDSEEWPLVAAVKDALRSIVYGPNGAPPSASPYDRSLAKLNSLLTVKRDGNTYVLGISMLSTDPEKSARIANRIAEIYVSESSAAAARSTMDAARVLDGRLEELRATVIAADEKVEAFKTENGLFGTPDALIVEQQLREINADLAKARLETATAKADIDAARRNSVESPVIAALEVSLAQALAREAELRKTLLPNHPNYAQLLEHRRALEGSIGAERDRILARYRSTYEAARDRERNLEERLLAFERQSTDSGFAAVRLRELERSAAANRSIYEAFLTRAKEATEQAGLPTSTVRLISSAYPASRPEYPQPLLLLSAAAALGALLGLMIAWLRNIPRPALARPTLPLTQRLGSWG